MRKLSLSFACALVTLCFSKTSFGQASATADASATIVTPISIMKTTDMNFGKVAVSASLGGTVLLAPADGSRTPSGGVTLPVAAGTSDVTPAIFTVSGEGAYTYSITLPNTALTITETTSPATMTVDNFTSSPSGTGTLASGTQTLRVGATLNVAAGQAAGLYTSTTPFSVTVNYN